MSLLADLKERWRQEKEPAKKPQHCETPEQLSPEPVLDEHFDYPSASDIPLSPPIVQTENDDATRTESGSSTVVQVDPAGVDPVAAADPVSDATLAIEETLRAEVQCQRCQHQWTPRTPDLPKQCPHCHSNYWTQPFKTPPLRPPKHKLEQWAFNRKIANLRFRARALNHELIDSKELAQLWQRLREAELRASQRGSPFSEPSPGNPLPKSESRAQRGRKGLAASSAPCVIPPPPGLISHDEE